MVKKVSSSVVISLAAANQMRERYKRAQRTRRCRSDRWSPVRRLQSGLIHTSPSRFGGVLSTGKLRVRWANLDLSTEETGYLHPTSAFVVVRGTVPNLNRRRSSPAGSNLRSEAAAIRHSEERIPQGAVLPKRERIFSKVWFDCNTNAQI
jgi:hypothetical protein